MIVSIRPFGVNFSFGMRVSGFEPAVINQQLIFYSYTLKPKNTPTLKLTPCNYFQHDHKIGRQKMTAYVFFYNVGY